MNVHLPKDRISMAHQGYGFCEFLTEEDAEYACKIMNQIKLWGKPIRVNKVRPRLVIPLKTMLIGFLSIRLRPIKNNWMLVQTFSLGIWTKMWMKDYFTTHSVRLA